MTHHLLSDVARIVHGFAFKGEFFTDVRSPYVLVTPGNFQVGGGWQDGKSPKYYKGPVPPEFVLSPGTLIVSMTDLSRETNTLGYAAIVPDSTGFQYLHNQRIGRVEIIRPDLVVADFLYFLLRWTSYRDEVLASATGTTVKHTSPSRILAFAYDFPGLEQQAAIADALKLLDDKIALNRRADRTLEAIAAALFRSWFLDFDPVRAKAEGVQAIGVPNAVYEFMPAQFVETPEGQIPAGWRWGTIAEEFNVRMGQSPPGSSYNEASEGTPFFQGCTDFGFRFPERRIFTRSPSRFADANDTLVSVRAPVGRVNMATERCCIGRGLAAVRHRGGGRSFTYYAMKALEERFSIFEGEGTLFGAITRKGFARIPIVVPTEDLVRAFDELAGTLDEQIALNEQESQILATLRSELLPQLLSGEAHIREMDHALAALP